MIRKSHLLALALTTAAVAVAAPIAQAGSAPKVDPLAVSYLIGQGLSPSEVTSWTTGACSHRSRPLRATRCSSSRRPPKPIDPLAVSYLIGQGLTPEPGAVLDDRRLLAAGQGTPPATRCSGRPSRSSTQVVRSTGFQWGDAGIGAGFTLGALLLVGGVGAGLLVSRKNRRRVAHA